MKYCRYIIFAAFCLMAGLNGWSQKVTLRFIPKMGGLPLYLDNQKYLVVGQDSVIINTLRFYISGIQLLQDGKPVWTEPDSYHLIDAAEPDNDIVLSAPANIHYNRLHFNLGIDSATNAGGAMGGALDATKGMYWAWQSGYINFKLEGTSPLCKTRKHEFEFHLGGFREDTYCMQPVNLPVKNTVTINIVADAGIFLKQIDLSQQATVMVPGAEAVALSKKAAQIFYVITGNE